MMQLIYLRQTLKVSVAKDCFSFVPKRFRYKRKWVQHMKTRTNCQLALNNFDAFYKPYFGELWPAIRISLQSLPKYCAVVNKYGSTEKVEGRLQDFDIVNFVEHARRLQSSGEYAKGESPEISVKTPHIDYLDHDLGVSSINNSVDKDDVKDSERSRNVAENSDILEPYDDDLYKENLNVFVPTEQVYSEKDQLLREEMNINTFQPRETKIDILSHESIHISPDIDALVFQRGDVTMFPQPKSYNQICGYYLMDAASVMPVLALDIRPTDQVLDLCAAPGGKSYLILQSLNLYAGGTLCCNESSPGRLTRLKSVIHSHYPMDIAEQVTISKRDGTEPLPAMYNKVLVDVPCNSDRHVVTEEENNFFKQSRTRERLGLMETQKKLLLSAIKSCIPGGTIVYSTCTLSPAQNDGVIQAAVEDLAESTEIEVAVEDLTPLTQLFSSTFKFHEKPRYGQLILPTLVNNFGPSYFAKLRRVK